MPDLDITTGQQTVTTAAAVTGSLTTTPVGSGDYTLHMHLESLTPGKSIRLAIQDSADGSFTDAVALWVECFLGEVAAGAGIDKSRRKYELPGAVIGTSPNKLRLIVLAIDSATSAKVHAWISY